MLLTNKMVRCLHYSLSFREVPFREARNIGDVKMKNKGKRYGKNKK